MSKPLENFLAKVKEKFANTDPESLWQVASDQIREEFCPIVLFDSQTKELCGLKKKDGICPYHHREDHDFWRSCTHLSNSGKPCFNRVYTRDINTVWCTHHLKKKRNSIRLQRLGEHIVLKDTPYAVSDSLLYIIGRVEATYDLQFVLRAERDAMMQEVAELHDLQIRLEEN